VVPLTRGYRVPAQVLDFANGLLPSLDAAVEGATSLRHASDALRLQRSDDLVGTVADVVADLASREGSIGVIAVDTEMATLRKALRRAGIDAPLVEHGMEAHVTLVPVTVCKGLEFDHVVVVEPAAITTLPRGLNWLYVALTRAVSSLTVVHADPLPRPLAA
jgi:DNA helicase IV